MEIINGDCLEVMKSMPDKSFDLVLTDPPYGIGEAAGKNKSRSKLAVAKDFGNEDWDNEPPGEEYFQEMFRVSRNQVIFGGNYFNLPPSPCWLVWDKDNGASDFADCELAWTSFKTAVRRLRHKWAGMLQQNMKEKEYRVHPTQKPVPVMRWVIENYTKETDTVLDPFMGSGTTLVAAKQLNRNATGIEISEEYCEIARKRLAETQVPIL